MSKKETNHRLNLAEKPANNSVADMQNSLRVAVFGAVKEKDVLDMVGVLKQLAIDGDVRAMRLYFDLFLGKEPPLPQPVFHADVSAGLKPLANAIGDLVDEIRIAKFTKEIRDRSEEGSP